MATLQLKASSSYRKGFGVLYVGTCDRIAFLENSDLYYHVSIIKPTKYNR